MAATSSEPSRRPISCCSALASSALRPTGAGTSGDSTWDMRAASAAGMVAIGVLAGAAVDEVALRDAGATLVVPTLGDLELPG